MSNIVAKFPESIFFSNKKSDIVKNDFYISFYKSRDSQPKQDTNASNPLGYVTAYILGLEQLFVQNDIETTMKNFAQALNNDNEWLIRYGNSPYGKCLIVECKADELSDPYTKTFQLPYKYEFSAKFSDKDAIGIVVHFDNFNILFNDLPQNITQEYIITANELAYVDDFAAIDSQGNRVKTVPKGEWVEISWSVGNVEKTSVSLCDENGEVVANEPSYKVQINEDRKFTLNLEKDGRIVTQTLPVNQISPVEVTIYNQDGERWWYHGSINNANRIERIAWSGENIEKYNVSLCDENGDIVAKESPYICRIDQYRSSGKLFTLKIERDGCLITKKIPISVPGWDLDKFFYISNRTEWFMNITEHSINQLKNKNIDHNALILLSKSLIDEFAYSPSGFLSTKEHHPIPDEKGSNLFFYTEKSSVEHCPKGFLIYIHPDIWVFNSADEYNVSKNYLWNILKHYDNVPNWNDVKCYKTNAGSECDIFISICYTLEDRIAIRLYYPSSNKWDKEITIEKDFFNKYADKDKDGEFLFCQGGPRSTSIYAVYQHVIYYFSTIPSNGDLPTGKFTLPEEAKEANIVSISNRGRRNDWELLAILCDNNYVYICQDDKVSCDKVSIYLEHIKKPKDILLDDKMRIIVDGYVIEFNDIRNISNQNKAFFSPRLTIDNPENMFFGITNSSDIKALTWDQKGKILWHFR